MAESGHDGRARPDWSASPGLKSLGGLGERARLAGDAQEGGPQWESQVKSLVFDYPSSELHGFNGRVLTLAQRTGGNEGKLARAVTSPGDVRRQGSIASRCGSCQQSSQLWPGQPPIRLVGRPEHHHTSITSPSGLPEQGKHSRAPRLPRLALAMTGRVREGGRPRPARRPPAASRAMYEDTSARMSGHSQPRDGGEVSQQSPSFLPVLHCAGAQGATQGDIVHKGRGEVHGEGRKIEETGVQGRGQKAAVLTN